MTDPIEHQFNPQSNQAVSLGEEGLGNVMSFSTIQDTTNTNEQKDNQQQTNEQSISEAGNQQLQFVQQIVIPDGFDDPYYQTILEIFSFFNQTIPLTTIMNAIHQAAGDVALAVQRLSQIIHINMMNHATSLFTKFIVQRKKLSSTFRFNS